MGRSMDGDGHGVPLRVNGEDPRSCFCGPIVDCQIKSVALCGCEEVCVFAGYIPRHT